MVAEKLAMQDIDSVIFNGAKPNYTPTSSRGWALLKETRCDFVVAGRRFAPRLRQGHCPVCDQRR